MLRIQHQILCYLWSLSQGEMCRKTKLLIPVVGKEGCIEKPVAWTSWNAVSWIQSRSLWSRASFLLTEGRSSNRTLWLLVPTFHHCLGLIGVLAILKPPLLRHAWSGGFWIIGPIFPMPLFLLYLNFFARKSQIKWGRYSWARSLCLKSWRQVLRVAIHKETVDPDSAFK